MMLSSGSCFVGWRWYRIIIIIIIVVMMFNIRLLH